ncbi:helix-turn-helix domain-containing protein [Paenibacillus marchantiae]|uniref:helix-turn-helix domain-containing protein n=1 Tax=Paenibacillus TaxID=44249 RepID=UPI00237C4249|nr:helix-turn-helix domain-containing protein [Paenibacillus marchantiae]WDQ33879.1 helix-turn-helix domain-containing protein [Paenibacillus marchantiae]
MSKRSRVSLEGKLRAVKQCIAFKSSPNQEAKQLGCSAYTVRKWIWKYKEEGLRRLVESRTWNAYSNELKQAAVQDVLSGRCSIEKAIQTYRISSRSVLSKWISKYTQEIVWKNNLQDKGRSHMKKGRKTTFEERIEIVKYTLTHELDYQKVAQKYDVSYSQVYAWVRKYKTGQEEALRDHRGYKKPVEKLNEQEQLKLRIKELEARNEYLEMENAFAKKLAEIERRKPR